MTPLFNHVFHTDGERLSIVTICSLVLFSLRLTRGEIPASMKNASSFMESREELVNYESIIHHQCTNAKHVPLKIAGSASNQSDKITDKSNVSRELCKIDEKLKRDN